jgi:hypothetical protein
LEVGASTSSGAPYGWEGWQVQRKERKKRKKRKEKLAATSDENGLSAAELFSEPDSTRCRDFWRELAQSQEKAAGRNTRKIYPEEKGTGESDSRYWRMPTTAEKRRGTRRFA